MIKKRSICAISVTLVTARPCVSFVRRDKNGKVQCRQSALSDQELCRLVRRVNAAEINGKGWFGVWSTGWSFYPKGISAFP